jgi:hypothetical protein
MRSEKKEQVEAEVLNGKPLNEAIFPAKKHVEAMQEKKSENKHGKPLDRGIFIGYSPAGISKGDKHEGGSANKQQNKESSDAFLYLVMPAEA